MANPWFRFYSEFEDDPKVVRMSEPMQLRLVKVFCSHCKEVTMSEDDRAFKWHISEEELAATKALFIEKGFIDENWTPLNWNKRQYISDSSTDRTRRYRERKRTSQERHSDGHVTEPVTTVTKCDALEADTEADTEQKRLEQRRGESVPSKKRGGEFASVATIFSNMNPRSTPRPFPSTVPGLVAGGYTLSNRSACRDCGAEVDWWVTPRGGQLPMNPDTAVVHMETCSKAERRAH
jgi:hypothetical protein